MTRRCSHCSNNGHNSRTCPMRGGGSGGGVKLFGVQLIDGSMMKKSASMGNLSTAHFHSSASPNPGSPSSDHVRDKSHVPDGYLSDDPAAHASTNYRGERKKGNPWTEEEHRRFLIGLQKLGKGDWRGISRNYVVSRTPTQVASHAQKYFNRQTNATRRKRRSSLFDMVPDDMATDTPMVPEEEVLLPSPPLQGTDNVNHIPSLNLSLTTEVEPVDSPMQETVKETEEENVTETSNLKAMYPAYFPAYVPVPYSFWPPDPVVVEENCAEASSHHQVLKPVPVLPKERMNVDQLVGISQLSIVDTGLGRKEPLASLSLKLIGEASRQSAFHASAPVGGSDLSNGGKTSAVQAV